MSTEHLKSFYVNRKELTVTYKGYSSNCFNADGSHAWYSNVQHYPNRQKFNDALLDFANEVLDGVITLPDSNTFKKRIYYILQKHKELYTELYTTDKSLTWLKIKNDPQAITILSGKAKVKVDYWVIATPDLDIGVRQYKLKKTIGRQTPTKFYDYDYAKAVFTDCRKINWDKEYRVQLIKQN